MKMIVKIIFPLMALWGAIAVSPAVEAATGVLFDQTRILHEFFPDADRIDVTDVKITPELGAKLKARLGYVPVSSHYSVFVGRKGGHDLGYAVIDEEKGMHEPITFAVLVGLDGAVQRQEVMVYREPEGDGVTSRRFTRQFVGKTIKDPIRAGTDITIVSSATISSNSMAVGVRRAVALVDEAVLAPAATALAPTAALPPAGSGS